MKKGFSPHPFPKTFIGKEKYFFILLLKLRKFAFKVLWHTFLRKKGVNLFEKGFSPHPFPKTFIGKEKYFFILLLKLRKFAFKVLWHTFLERKV